MFDQTNSSTTAGATKQAFIAPQLREIAPYIQSLKGSLAVVFIPGELSMHSAYQSVINDLILLNSIGVQLAIVFGSRPQINQVTEQPAQYHNNIRITNQQDMQRIVELCASERLRHQKAFSIHGSGNASISIVWGNWISARPLGVIDGVDLLYAGAVRRIHTKSVRNLLANGHITLFDSIALSPTGDTYNLVAEELALELAIHLQADKLMVYCNLSDYQLEVPARLTMSKAQQLIDASKNQSNQALATAITARKSGVDRIHLLDMHLPGAILQELLTINGAGIMLSDDDYESIGAACEQDIGAILALIKPMIADGTLLPRDQLQLETDLHSFRVMRRDQVIIGCYALHHLCDDVVELGCFAVLPQFQRANLGRELLADAMRYIRNKSLVTFTTRTRDWFIENGFVKLTKAAEQLPQSLKKRMTENTENDRHALCLIQKNSPLA